METRKFLERRALLAGACALPLAAVAAVVARDDEDAWIPDAVSGCREDTAPPAPAFDCVSEDDGEP